MLIPGISEIGDRGLNAGRWAAAARASRQRPAAAPRPALSDPGADRDAGEAPDWTPPQAMTLAAAQAAYAAN